MGIPAVITEEDPEINGPTDEAVLASLRAGAPVFTKTVFGLADCPEIMAAVRSTGRRTALLAGFETDVCVTHSAAGLGEEPAIELSLSRMRCLRRSGLTCPGSRACVT